MSLSVIYGFENKSYRLIFERAVDYNGYLLDIDIIDEIDDETERKIINISKVYRSIDYDIKEIDTEIKRLRKLKEVAENNKEQLRRWLQFNMLALGKKVIDTPTMKITLRNTNPRLVIEKEDNIPEDYYTVETKTTLNKEQLKTDIKEGKEITGVFLMSDQAIVIK
jgi:hypothetical protein